MLHCQTSSCQYLYCILGGGLFVTDCDVKQLLNNGLKLTMVERKSSPGNIQNSDQNRFSGPLVRMPLMIEDSRQANDNKA